MEKCNNKKILIIVPHQDDELSLAGSVIIGLKKRGYFVGILFTTNGNFNGQEQIRYKESKKVAEILKIDTVTYLGYPDSGWNMEDNTIYNSNTFYKTKDGINETCGIMSENEYCFKKNNKHNLYTRENMLNDLKNFILDFKPFAIFCVDVDNHADHKITSLLTDEAMASLKDQLKPTPLFFKGFCYLGSWYGKNDYFDKIMQPTLNQICNKTTLSKPYLWEDRISIFADPHLYNPFYWKSKLYKCYKVYSSQEARLHFFRAVNSNQIFWFRNLTNIGFDSTFIASSGNVSFLNDGKLIDFKNVRRKNEYTNLLGWEPNKKDKKKIITIELKERVDFLNCSIYFETSNNKPIDINVITKEKQFKINAKPPLSRIEIKVKEKMNRLCLQFLINNDQTIIINEIELHKTNLQVKMCEDFLSKFEEYKDKPRNLIILNIGRLFYTLQIFIKKVFNKIKTRVISKHYA